MTEDRPAPPPPIVAPPPYPVDGQPTRTRRPAWFWIAIIGGCFALFTIMLFLIALAVPQMLKVKKNANQTSAIQTMRTITSAEVIYYTSYPGTGYACSLGALGGDPNSGAPTAQVAQLIPSALAATGQKEGYTFTVTCNGKTSYQLTAVPQTIGKTGDNGYCVDENNDISIDPTGGTKCTQPLQ